MIPVTDPQKPPKINPITPKIKEIGGSDSKITAPIIPKVIPILISP